MHKLIAAATLVAALTLPGTTLAAPGQVYQERASLDGTSHDLNICNWPSTFTATGQTHLVVVDSGDQFHFTFHETANWTLTVDDDPGVPEAFRGVIWRGRNEETIVGNFDLAGPRAVFHSVNLFSEGPFHGLSLRETFVVDANGIVRIDRQVIDEDVDCTALTA
jgi:hypothetical protein